MIKTSQTEHTVNTTYTTPRDATLCDGLCGLALSVMRGSALRYPGGTTSRPVNEYARIRTHWVRSAGFAQGQTPSWFSVS